MRRVGTTPSGAVTAGAAIHQYVCGRPSSPAAVSEIGGRPLFRRGCRTLSPRKSGKGTREPAAHPAPGRRCGRRAIRADTGRSGSCTERSGWSWPTFGDPGYSRNFDRSLVAVRIRSLGGASGRGHRRKTRSRPTFVVPRTRDARRARRQPGRTDAPHGRGFGLRHPVA
jgi:hypothetical protein